MSPAPAIQFPTAISASRIGSMLGLNPRQTPLALYLQMRGEMPPLEDNEVLEEGREFEDAIAKIACRKYGLRLLDAVAPGEVRRGNLVGHPDRLVRRDKDGEVFVLEIKNTLFGEEGEGGWGQPGTDQVPRPYWLQSGSYGWMRRDPFTLLAARLRGGTVLYEIPVDDAVMQKVDEEAGAFLQRVRDGVPPDPLDEADHRRRWLVVDEEVAIGTSVELELLRSLRDLREQQKAAKDAESKIATLLLGFAKDAGRIDVPHPVTGEQITVATLQSDRRFDMEAFLREQGETAMHYKTLDTAALRKKEATLYERYMRKPLVASEQKRVIRIKGDLFDAPAAEVK